MTNITTRKPSVKLVHGKATTTSLKIADVFGKRHDHVLRAIQNLQCSAEFTALNFGASEYTDKTGRKLPMYTITRDGFAFLASGFTGKEAAQWKEKFIEAFNKLEQAALEKAAERRAKPGALKPAHQPVPQARAALPAIASELQTRINKRAWELAHAAYDDYRKRMMDDVMVKSGHTRPEAWPDEWTPLENSQDVLEQIFCAAKILEAHANSINIRGRRLAEMVGKDYVKATAKYRPGKDEK